jgi:hypothetical protein
MKKEKHYCELVGRNQPLASNLARLSGLAKLASAQHQNRGGGAPTHGGGGGRPIRLTGGEGRRGMGARASRQGEESVWGSEEDRWRARGTR